MLIINYTLIYAAVLTFTALGGMYSERSGVINLGLEGVMVIGALAGAFVLFGLPAGTNSFLTISLSILASGAAGMIFSLLLAVAAINFKADQTLVGIAMNMLATAGSTVLVKSFNTIQSNGSNPSAIIDYYANSFCSKIKIGNTNFSVYILIALALVIISHILLFRTRFGLRLMACGEHPQAADSVGINVYRTRYTGVLISGLLGGIGGLIYISAVNTRWNFEYGIAGAGFLAIAVMIFGQWNPVKILAAALIFGLFRAISDIYTAYDTLLKLLPGEVYKMLPYIISLLVLSVTSKKSRAPKAEGIPYDKSSR